MTPIRQIRLWSTSSDFNRENITMIYYWIIINAMDNPPWLETFFEMNHKIMMRIRTFRVDYTGYEYLLVIQQYQKKHSSSRKKTSINK